MSDEDRAELAARLTLEQNDRFQGVAIRAYTAAGVNAATWARAVNGLSIKPHTQRAIVANLWPETRGDWTKIPAEPEVLNVAEQMRAILERNRRLEQQVEELKRAVGQVD